MIKYLKEKLYNLILVFIKIIDEQIFYLKNLLGIIRFLEHLSNIHSILVTLLVFHFDILDNDDNDEHS